ncbi:MAG: ABC transporter ATP-binding protein [Sagittula sp.]|jgi:nitrate/nitrite transport system ATP-binding protein|uniref:ABC transporter ATP-binding protein n=1 Tax=unclassified Sagittula TaxID=2624628 RepID=UPI000C2D1B5D|nr:MULTISPECIES: ABC transporter ATP-binding protein [unclassified Sagittula]AUC54977.1 nitrate/sulfonate/bicarbonate ABC transporter ATP-binding protein [Sagittula sp. P11]WHZ33635.1 ABC transporter ATP-binding protein [Sagittula sp. MA-2]
MTKPYLSVEKLTQSFPDGKGGTMTVFEDATFGVEKGEFVCILGHSGCGKSTIMNILAGLAEPTSGVVKMDGFEVSGPSLDRGVVFQNYSLLPWLSALRNVMFGVKARHPDWSRAKVAEHSEQYLSMVGLEGDAIHRKPAQLSGGMRQRVSIARAFANHPKLLLLDEPFGALDALTRGTIQEELLKIWSRTQQTVFMITHDIDEAILLADRILLMTNGPLARVAESVEITIDRPRNRTEIVEHPNYYAIRNHLVQFLGRRSKELAGQPSNGVPQSPETVRIDLTETPTEDDSDDSPRLRAVHR